MAGAGEVSHMAASSELQAFTQVTASCNRSALARRQLYLALGRGTDELL